MDKTKIIIAISIPILSFALQYIFSSSEGAVKLMLGHYNVSVVDFVFIPLNIYLFKAIDWKKGFGLFIIMTIAFGLSGANHYAWAVSGADPGHMIVDGVITRAGWIHVLFSGIEFGLMLAFFAVPAQMSKKLFYKVNVWIGVYLVGSLAGSYFIHVEFLTEDLIRIFSGLVIIGLYMFFGKKMSVVIDG